MGTAQQSSDYQKIMDARTQLASGTRSLISVARGRISEMLKPRSIEEIALLNVKSEEARMNRKTARQLHANRILGEIADRTVITVKDITVGGLKALAGKADSMARTIVEAGSTETPESTDTSEKPE